MGTRSTISAVNLDGTVTSIYCHWDGYLDHNGQILHDHYGTEKKVRALLELGSLSSLREEIGEEHIPNSRENRSWCTAYHRDSKESWDSAKPFMGPLSEVDHQEYNYLFRNGAWEVSEDMETWTPLTVALVADKLEG